MVLHDVRQLAEDRQLGRLVLDNGLDDEPAVGKVAQIRRGAQVGQRPLGDVSGDLAALGAAVAPSISTSTTSMPARAQTSAMPESMMPPPTTPTRSIGGGLTGTPGSRSGRPR